MERVFLDANVLFSAAYRADSGLLKLWRLPGIQLCSSSYAVEEARVNLDESVQLARLRQLDSKLLLFESTGQELRSGVFLPAKDVPILLAAMVADCEYLLTGDLRHFGPYLGQRIAGVQILTPGDFLRARNRSR